MIEKVRVQYVRQDSYILDFPQLTLVFGPEFLPRKLKRDRPILFLSSQRQQGFDYRQLFYPGPSQVLLPQARPAHQQVVPFSPRPQQRLLALAPYDGLWTYGAQVQAYPGFVNQLAYLVQVGDLTCFYGGRLDFYPQPGQGPRGRQRRAQFFLAYLDQIQAPELDLVFFSIQATINHRTDLAPRALMDRKKASVFFPLNHQGDLAASRRFARHFQGRPTQVLGLDRPGQVFDLTLTLE